MHRHRYISQKGIQVGNAFSQIGSVGNDAQTIQVAVSVAVQNPVALNRKQGIVIRVKLNIYILIFFLHISF